MMRRTLLSLTLIYALSQAQIVQNKIKGVTLNKMMLMLQQLEEIGMVQKIIVVISLLVAFLIGDFRIAFAFDRLLSLMQNNISATTVVTNRALKEVRV
jgi:hypothetical protein